MQTLTLHSGWTSCNGPNWVDFLTTDYNSSTLLTYNLADGGATIDTATVLPWKPGVYSLIDQVHERFLPYYGRNASWKADNTLFAFWIGINDVGNTYWDSNASRVDKELGIYRGLLEEVCRRLGMAGSEMHILTRELDRFTTLAAEIFCS